MSAALLSVFMLAVLLMISWKVTLAILLVVGIFSLLSNKLIGSYSRRVGEEKLKCAKSIGNQVSESITAIKQVKTLGMEPRILNSFSKVVADYIKTLSDFRVNSSLPQNVGEVFVVFVLVATVLYVVTFTEADIKSLVPMVAVFIVVGNRISVQVALLVNSSMQILSNIVSLRRIYGLVKDDVEFEELDKGCQLKSLDGDIEFRNISFSYNKEHDVFRNLNFVIPRGKMVFLIGDSGSGKSTLVDLLLQLRQPQSGLITVGDRPLSTFSIESWRKTIGYVSQDVMLFNKSIKENIRDGMPDSSDDEIKNICKRVNAEEFIQILPDGYETNVGDRGVKLSGGQNQRLVLARSMLHDPELLIFDEATSALDQKLEQEIIKEIKSSSAGKTILFITHRLATAKFADIVYRLDEGQIVKIPKSTYSELKKNKFVKISAETILIFYLSPAIVFLSSLMQMPGLIYLVSGYTISLVLLILILYRIGGANISANKFIPIVIVCFLCAIEYMHYLLSGVALNGMGDVRMILYSPLYAPIIVFVLYATYLLVASDVVRIRHLNITVKLFTYFNIFFITYWFSIYFDLIAQIEFTNHMNANQISYASLFVSFVLIGFKNLLFIKQNYIKYYLIINIVVIILNTTRGALLILSALIIYYLLRHLAKKHPMNCLVF